MNKRPEEKFDPLDALIQQIDESKKGESSFAKSPQGQLSPQFESNVAALREAWKTKGAPCLRELRDLEKKLGPKFARAAAIDFLDLERQGVSLQKLIDAEETIAQAQKLLGQGIRCLEGIPRSIEQILPEQEASCLHGGKRSDYILLEMGYMLVLPEEIRHLVTVLDGHLERIRTAHRWPVAFAPSVPDAPLPDRNPKSAETDFHIFFEDGKH